MTHQNLSLGKCWKLSSATLVLRYLIFSPGNAWTFTFCIFPHLEPLHSPVPITMSNTSSTSLHVAWGEVPDAFHHGEVMGYRVFLEETGHAGIIIGNGSFPLHVNYTDFTGLKKFTSYMTRVRAYSFFGEGPEGTVTTLTDEDSKFLVFNILITRNFQLRYIYM